MFTLRRTLQIKMLEWKKTYECTNSKCKFQFQVIADVERDNIIEMPVSLIETAPCYCAAASDFARVCARNPVLGATQWCFWR